LRLRQRSIGAAPQKNDRLAISGGLCPLRQIPFTDPAASPFHERLHGFWAKPSRFAGPSGRLVRFATQTLDWRGCRKAESSVCVTALAALRACRCRQLNKACLARNLLQIKQCRASRVPAAFFVCGRRWSERRRPGELPGDTAGQNPGRTLHEGLRAQTSSPGALQTALRTPAVRSQRNGEL